MVRPIEQMDAALLQTSRPIEPVMAGDHNAALKPLLEPIAPPPRHRARVLPFTTEVDEYMAAAELVVPKPGGLTVAEALARGAVLVMVQPVPGQESRNSDYLLEHGAAVKANNLPQLVYKVDALLAEPERLAGLRANRGADRAAQGGVRRGGVGAGVRAQGKMVTASWRASATRLEIGGRWPTSAPI